MTSNDVMLMNPQALEREFSDRSDAAIENELCTLNANLNAATYRFLVLIREFDLRRAWGEWGMCSMAHWLGWRCGIGIVAAREHLRLAHALAELPETAALFAEGRISYSKVRALTRVATEETESFFLNVAQHGTAGHLERVVRYARQGLAFDDPDRVRSLVTKSFCDWHYDDDGMLVLRARLMADDGAKLVAALESMREHVVGESTLPSHDARDGNLLSALPVSARRAVALAAIAEAAAGMVIDPDRDCANGTSRSVPQIVVHIHSLPSNGPHGCAESSVCVDDSGREDSTELSVCTDECRNDDSAESSERADHDRAGDSAESLRHVHREHTTECEGNSSASPSYIENAVAIPVATARRLSCDASVVAMIERADGAALSIGRRRRTIPPAIRRALQSRDPCCRFPGCSHTRFVHAHHIQHWADGGHTSLSNLVTLCGYHHKLVHEGGYACSSTVNDELVFYTPEGQRIAHAPRSVAGRDNAIAGDNASYGVRISATTGDSQWDGQRVDYDHVMFSFFGSRAVMRGQGSERETHPC